MVYCQLEFATRNSAREFAIRKRKFRHHLWTKNPIQLSFTAINHEFQLTIWFLSSLVLGIYFILYHVEEGFSLRREEIRFFFWSLICERIFYNVFSCYIFINHSRWVETVKEIATLSIKIEPWYEIRSARHGRVQVKRIFKSKFLIRALAKLIASVQKSEWRVLQNFFFNYRIVYFNRILIWNVEYDLFWTFWIYILWFI